MLWPCVRTGQPLHTSRQCCCQASLFRRHMLKSCISMQHAPQSSL